MTLSTVPQYDAGAIEKRGGRAVVVGGSIAGLCAARVLADRFPRVTILERDDLPDDPAPRRGVPQGPHAHNLHRAGLKTIEDLVPGYGDALLAAGGVRTDLGSDWEIHTLGDTLAETPGALPTTVASRPLLEHVLRRRVTDLEAVRLRASHQCREYLVADDDTAVVGVTVRNEAGETETLGADLVVDATGRTSRTPAWLETHGRAAPPTAEQEVDVAYSTVLLERPPDDEMAFQVVANPRNSREAIALPIEGERWIVVLAGRDGDHPPTDPGELVAFADGLATSRIGNLLENHAWVSGDVRHYRFPSNRRYRYEELERFPDGLVVVGDAIASFNPVYGQGMSVAALEALVLHHALAETGLEGLGRRFFERVAPVVDGPWFLATGLDSALPETTGPTPDGTGAFNEYMARVVTRAHDDGEVAGALHRVTQLEEPPASLLRPAVAGRVFDAGEQPRTQTGESGWTSFDAVERFLEGELSDPDEVAHWPGLPGTATGRERRPPP